MNRWDWRPVLVLGGIVLALMCAGEVIPRLNASLGTPTPTRQPAERAWHECTVAVERNFGPKPEDAAPFRVGDMHTLAQSKYRISVRYPNEGAVYVCEVVLSSDGSTDTTDVRPGP